MEAENVGIDQRLARLTPAQRALFEERLLESAARPPATAGFLRGRATARLPFPMRRSCSWLLSQVFDDGIAYNAPGAFQLEGPLDLERARRVVRGARRAPRDPAHDLLGDRRRARCRSIAADAPSRDQRRRPARSPPDEQRGGGAADPQGGVALRVRPRQRAGHAPDRDPARRRRAHPDARTCTTSRPTATRAARSTAT